MSTQPPEQTSKKSPQSVTLSYLPEYSADVEQNQSRRGPSTPVMIIVAFVLILLLFGFVLLAIWLAQTQATTIAAVRDILIIVLALESCLFGIVIMLLLVMMIRLVNTLEFEIKPILEKTNETLGTLRGTTTFLSQNLVQPTIRTRAHMAGVRRAFKTLFGDPRDNIK